MKRQNLIFIPTYNERDNVTEMGAQLLALPLDADIVFMDDNSPDGTGAILDRLAQENERVSVIHRAHKNGIGSAHQQGIAWAYEQGCETLITMDCDFTHSPSDIPRLLQHAPDYALIVGSRYLQKDSLPGWNLLRRSLTTVGHLLTHHLLRLEHDATGAFRVYNLRRIPREVFGLVESRGYSFFFESLLVLAHNGFSIREVPIVLSARTYGSSKMSLREAAHSVARLFSLFVARHTNPSRFRLVAPDASHEALQINPQLSDKQGWDEYWDKKQRAGNLIYETIATLYRQTVIRRQLGPAIRRHFKRGAQLLHAGCGSGQVDMDIQNFAHITAVDLSTSALRLYRKNNSRAHAVRHADILQLPFEDASFDGVYNLGVMEHFTAHEIQAILAEFHRVLKPDGKIVLFWPHQRASSVLVLKIVHWLMNRRAKQRVQLHPPEISLLRSQEEVESRLRQAHFQPTHFRFGARDGFVQAVVVAKKQA